MKNYSVRFGTGDPRTYTGLAPTFLIFTNLASGATVTPPSIAEVFAGTGIYTFQWGVTTPIGFLIDAATTSPGVSGRYVTGQLDPVDAVNESMTGIIASIGSTASSFGTSATDPVDLFGYLKRVQELLEGNNMYYKASGAFTMLSRGSSYTLASKTIANSISLVTKL
jgi:hypothetical protein